MSATVCNYALLRFLPYPETGEFVNVGVVVNCLQPCFIHFVSETKMPARAKALFPKQDEYKYEAIQATMKKDLERLEAMVKKFQDPKSCMIAFNEVVRGRESILRFGEVKTILTDDPQNFSEELFNRYIRMGATSPQVA